ncbi:hypothetical protein ACFX12_018831 [Malus domestica]
MHKTLILAAESMCVDQDVVKCAKEAEVVLVAQLLSATEKIDKLKYEIAVMKGSDADFYKLGYVDHLQGRPSNYQFFKNDFETFSISPVDLLNFWFKATFGGVVEGQAVQAEASTDELMEVLAAEGMAVEEPVVAQAAKE